MVVQWRILYLLGLVLLIGATASAQEPGLPDSNHSDRESLEKQSAGYPELPASDLAAVISIHVEKSGLAVFTTLPPTVGPARVKIKNLPGLCRVNIHMPEGRKTAASYTPEIFSFEHFDFSQPGTTTATTVQVTGWNLQVSQDIESPTDMKQVSLVQTPPDASDGNVGIRLRVTVQGNNGDPPAVNIERSAADFLSLRRQYPSDTARYLEPIFRDLHAEAAVFGPDRKLAWEVFAPDAATDPKVNAAVKQILARLDADNFRDREAAAADLQKLGQPAAICLSRWNRAGLSPEVNSRIDAFLSSYRPLPDADAQRLRGDVNFLIDCLYDNDNFIVQSALARLHQVTGRTIQFDPALRDDARRAAIDQLRQSLTPTTTQP
jgi:hypothetical protein